MPSTTLSALRKTLLENSDKVYRDFNIKTNPGAVNSLGVRMPILRKLAKSIARDWGTAKELLQNNEFGQNFEENILRGLVIAYAKIEAAERLKYLKDFVPRIQDWGTCDCVVATFRISEQNQPVYWDFLLQYRNSDQEFETRFMFVMFLDHFLNSKYLPTILDFLNQDQNRAYYAEMAKAWLVAESFTCDFDQALAYMTSSRNQLSDFTYNKALQKACESFRIAPEQKILLRSLKRKKLGSEKSQEAKKSGCGKL